MMPEISTGKNLRDRTGHVIIWLDGVDAETTHHQMMETAWGILYNACREEEGRGLRAAQFRREHSS